MDDMQNLNQVILDSLPHWAMLINVKNRTVLAANRLAKEGGASLECQCWDDFGHRQFLTDEHKKLIEQDPERKRDNVIKCEFCLADEAIEEGKPTRKEVEIEGLIWDVWWVPVGKDTYLHYAMDITELRKAEETKLKAAQLDSTLKTVGSICHNINQPLQVLMSSLEILEDEFNPEFLREAKNSALIIGEITKKLQNIFKYETKVHIDGSMILDIDASSE